jgi:hypothetical protein
MQFRFLNLFSICHFFFFSWSSYLFHYVVEKGIIYLCITDKGFPRRQAFAFLEDVKQRFEKAYESQMHGALAYAMNEDFARTLQRQMVGLRVFFVFCLFVCGLILSFNWDGTREGVVILMSISSIELRQ